jgi:spermidine/putrescine transport system substrate-binding protein
MMIRFLKLSGSIVLLMVIFTLSIFCLTGCGGTETPAEDGALADTIYMLNWSDYIDPDVVAQFEEEYGVKVEIDFYADMEELLAKIQANPGVYDLMVTSDYMLEVMIELDLLDELNYGNIPNIDNVIPYFKSSAMDPEGKYSVIYAFGTTGLAYNTKYVENADSWEVLWDPRYKGRVSIMDSAREGIAPILQYLGYSINTRDENELMAARDAAISLKPNLLDFIIVGMEEMLAAEEVWLMQTWSGRALRAQAENPAIEYTIPKEGGSVWLEYLNIPKDAPHKETAEVFINFLLDGEVNLANALYIQYGTGNQAALDVADPEYRDNEIINPPIEVLERMEPLTDVGEATELYDRFWTEVLAAR